MSNVVDMRGDRFLKELSQGTQISTAAKVAGIDVDELVQMLEDNPKFCLTTREVIVDHVEDKMRQDVASQIEAIRETARTAIHLIEIQREEAVMRLHEPISHE